MSVSEITKLVYSGLEQNGLKGRIVSIEHVADLKEEIEAHHNEGVLDETLFREFDLAGFESGIPEDVPSAKSLIIIAAPQPQCRVKFNFRGRLFHLTIPPTYSHKTDETVDNLLTGILKPEGFHLRPALLPYKLLAVRSGLARYGKNNISYIESLGSFPRLRAFFSDLPITKDSWNAPQMLEQCKNCRACVNNCPTGAIIEHRFLVQADKCLTFYNERKGQFHDWIEPSWHNCLIGCMRCQSVCPVNKRLIDWFEDKESFTEEETELILKGTSRYQLPGATTGKLERLSLLDDIDVIPRNLKALLKQCEGS